MRQSWRKISPPPHGLCTVDGAGVLDEDLGGLGALFWDLARDVVLWADSPPEEAQEVLTCAGERMRVSALLGAAGDDLPSSALMVLAGMVGNPAGARRGVIAAACGRIAEWAEERGGTATALVFALAAAHCFPQDALRAFHAGRLARRRAEYPRAEAWLRYAIVTGRRTRSWEAYGRGYLGLGNLHVQKGSYPRARRCHLRALRVAQRFRQRAVERDAYHDLFGIAAEMGDLAEAHRYARKALRLMGSTHPRLPAFANDLAYAWMVHGDFVPALRVFENVLPYCDAPSERVVVLSSIGRAAAGCGDHPRFESVWGAVWALAGELMDQGHVAQAMLELAQGACMLGDWTRAEIAANCALTMARGRGQARIQFTAESVLDRIVRERGVTSIVRDRPDQRYGVSAEQQGLVEDLTASLVTRAGATS